MSGAPSPFASSFQAAPSGAMDREANERLFDAIDRNHDGYITHAEFRAALSGQYLPAAAPGAGPQSAPVMSVFPPGVAGSQMPEGPAVAAAPPSLPTIAAPAPSAPLMTSAQYTSNSPPAVVPPMTMAPSQLPPRNASAPPMVMAQNGMTVAVPPGPASMPAQVTYDEDSMRYTPTPAPVMAMAPATSHMDMNMNATGPVQGGNMGSLFNFGKKEGVFLASPIDFMRIFPTLFTIFCFVIFTIPIWLTYHIGRDAQVKYWIGSLCSDVLLLPILFLIVHLIHNNRGRPSKPAMIAALLGSCVLILVVADYTLLAAYGKGNLLKSKDCTSFEHKHDLQLQWANAKAFYNNCMQATAAKSGLTYDAAVNLYRIEDCIEYEDQKDNNPGWGYLADLEETYACSGWCVHDQPMWTFKAVKDSCSQVVADVMFNKVQWTMTQVVVYTLIVLGFCSVGLLAAGPIFKSLGYSW